MRCIDLNADLGEGDPFDDELLGIVSSCNIACGGHAGDADSIAATIQAAMRNNVAAGAHPGYPDKAGFGRTSGFMVGDGLYQALLEQVTLFADIAAQLGSRMTHVKPHGALYNDAINNADLAEVIVRVIDDVPGHCACVGMHGSALEDAARQHNLPFIAEGFVDRAYEADASLVSRAEPGAVYSDLSVITTQAVRIATTQKVTARSGEVIAVHADTLCIHGDTPGAAAAAQAVRDVLESHGVEIRAVTFG